MPNFKLLSVLFCLSLFSSCGKPIPELQDIDLVVWKEDRNACMGNRINMVEAMDNQKDKLKALSEMDLVKLLGKPDENQLLDRSQKIYTYYFEAGPACQQPKAYAKKLILRFNAMGLAKEALIK